MKQRPGRTGPPAARATWLVLLGLGGCVAPDPLDVSTPTGAAGIAAMSRGREVPGYAFDVAGEAGVDRRCLANVIAADLLTRNGNPAIEIGVNGIRGAAYLSFTESQLGIYASDRLALPVLDTIAAGSLSGEGDIVLVKATDVEVAQGRAQNVRGIDLGASHETVAGRRPIAVLGYDFLGRYDMLLDMPRQRVMLFRTSGAPGCPPPSRWIAAAHRAPLVEDQVWQRNSVVATLDGHPVDMALEPAADTSIVTGDDAEAAGYVPRAAGPDDPVRTRASGVMLGVRHRFGSISIGDWHCNGVVVNIEPARYSLLGVSFLRHRKVLVGILEGALFFGDEHPDLLPADSTRAEPGPISSRVALVHVDENPRGR